MLQDISTSLTERSTNGRISSNKMIQLQEDPFQVVHLLQPHVMVITFFFQPELGWKLLCLTLFLVIFQLQEDEYIHLKCKEIFIMEVHIRDDQLCVFHSQDCRDGSYYVGPKSTHLEKRTWMYR
ncbi:hypothetical protein AVEN_38855-1 [Araneus ventricosus]|uniref:Uncharacterized protein n=1 Tax=Araneus ventricosus TaxID=182803 RepID=A0A4Y2SXM0_ARAVE|nr:hypothetical protein AVEN_38855-1 [Araneus ventricosus]